MTSLGQEAGVGHARGREERRQLGFVLAARVRVVVLQAELTDQRPASYSAVSSAVS